MKEITLCTDDARLARLAVEVRDSGESIVLVVDGEQIARLEPMEFSSERRKQHDAAIEAIEKGWLDIPKITREEIRSAIEEGRA